MISPFDESLSNETKIRDLRCRVTQSRCDVTNFTASGSDFIVIVPSKRVQLLVTQLGGMEVGRTQPIRQHGNRLKKLVVSKFGENLLLQVRFPPIFRCQFRSFFGGVSVNKKMHRGTLRFLLKISPKTLGELFGKTYSSLRLVVFLGILLVFNSKFERYFTPEI